MKKKAYKKSIAFITAMLMTFGTVSAVPSEYLPTIRVSAEESTSEGIAVDENNFPDPVFRDYLLSNTYNKDNPEVLSQSEINNILQIDLNNSEVKSLQGIEYLTAVTTIYCNYSSLTTLKLNDNKNLMTINVKGCQLTSLDLSNNPNLTSISCEDNNLTELNLNGCTALKSLYFSNNKLESIDLSDNNALTHLLCNNNQLKELDLSGNTNLMHLECSGNQLNSLDISKCYDSSLAVVCDNNSSKVPSENNCIAISELEKYGFDLQKVTNWVDCTYDSENDRIIAHHPIISYIYNVGYVYERTFTLTLADYKGTEINETNFPDEAFRDYILTKDTDDDNMLSEKEKSKAAIIEVNNKGIQSLKGIEFFKDHLKCLCCNNNQLTELDISQNTQLTELQCYDNQLTKLDVSQNTQLKNLICYNNQLTELDVSANTQLTKLNCNNNQLTELDVSANTQLTNLICYNNQLTELDVSANTQLTNLGCNDNQLTELDVSANTQLTYLICNDNKLACIDISKNTGITTFSCLDNTAEITVKDNIFDLSALKGFDPVKASEWKDAVYNAENNTITVMNDTVTYNYNCGNDKIVEFTFNVSGYVNNDIPINETNFPDKAFRDHILNYIDQNRNGYLSKEDIEAIKALDLHSKDITSLKGIEYFTELTELYCDNNSLTELDLSKNTKLTYLNFENNQLAFIDLTANTALETVYCNGNTANVTAENNVVDFSEYVEKGFDPVKASEWTGGVYNAENNTITAESKTVTYKYDCGNDICKTFTLNVSGLVLSGIAVNEENFPYEPFRDVAKSKDTDGNGELSADEISDVTYINVSDCGTDANLKGIEYFTELTSLDCSGINLTELDLSKNTKLTQLLCGENNLSSLDLSKNTALKTLNCSSNNLSSLDLSKNTALTNLNCSSNKLSSLDLSKNTALKNLDCDSNNLEKLDLSSNIELTELYCGFNKLTLLDLSKNSKLTWLICYNNKLTSLDLSKNTALTYLYCDSNNLEKLDVSGNTELTALYCGNNNLAWLDLSKNSKLTDFSCSNNVHNVKVENNIIYLSEFEGFDPVKASEWSGGVYNPADNTVKVKGVAVRYRYDCGYGEKPYFTFAIDGYTENKYPIDEATFPDDNFRTFVKVNYDNDNDDFLSESEIENVLDINFCGYVIEDLTGIELFTELNSIIAESIGLKTLDLSKNIALEYLVCKGNPLTSLDLSNNTALASLYCEGNQLTSLDVSKNTALTTLHCSGNQLTSLDVSNNTALTTLYCGGNPNTTRRACEQGDFTLYIQYPTTNPPESPKWSWTFCLAPLWVCHEWAVTQ